MEMFFYGKSDIGKRRPSNQDSFFTRRIADNAVLCVVCDGMGGAAGGNIASEITVKAFSEYLINALSDALQDGRLITDALSIDELYPSAASEANRRVYERAEADPSLQGMGTTLVAALIADSTLFAANIGDSRLYLITRSEMKQISHDHSFIQYLIDIGQLTPEEARNSPSRNIITRAVGHDAEIETDTFTVDLGAYPEGCVLLCSDGLTNYLSEEKIASVLREKTAGEDGLRRKVDRLIDLANENGGGDNVTAVAIEYKNENAEKNPFSLLKKNKRL